MRDNRGFSIIELFIVVVIIGLIAAIAIPNLLAARRSANDGSAVSSLRTLHGANVTYAATTGGGDYAGLAATQGVSSLVDLSDAELIDKVLGLGEKSGYSFVGDRDEGSSIEPETFYFSANPVTSSGLLMSGTKRFGVATDAVLRFDSSDVNLSVPFDALTLVTAQPMNN